MRRDEREFVEREPAANVRKNGEKKMKIARLMTLAACAGLATPALAQDSVSSTGAGDALDAYDTTTQVVKFSTKLTPFSSSLGNSIEYGNSLEILASLSRGDSGNEAVFPFSIIKTVPGMELPGLSGDPLSDDAAFSIDQYRHGSASRSGNDFLGCIRHRCRSNHIEA